MSFNSNAVLTIGDEVWVATALLHRDHPERQDFSRAEIEERLQHENIVGRLRPGVIPHIYLHAVANRPPRPGRLRLLFATRGDRRRLYRRGDPYDAGRQGPFDHGGTRAIPERERLPAHYRELVDWYLGTYAAVPDEPRPRDPILALRGLGRAIWDELPDAYVERLRAGWA